MHGVESTILNNKNNDLHDQLTLSQRKIYANQFVMQLLQLFGFHDIGF